MLGVGIFVWVSILPLQADGLKFSGLGLICFTTKQNTWKLILAGIALK